uniref:Protein TASOR-like n=1 Tax=Sinocyclocheilus rhinocerous TaxID=307959 RepID=A0A673LHP3_9TELE
MLCACIVWEGVWSYMSVVMRQILNNDTFSFGYLRSIFVRQFMEKRRELKQDGRTEKELSETFCFLLCDAQKVSVVCERGLSVGSSWISMLGNPSKGVYLCQFSDLLQIGPIEPGSTGNIIIFKVIKGKVKSVHDCMSVSMDPTPKFESHFSKNSTRVTSLQSYRAFEYTQQYFYEYVDFEVSSRPRHVCPYAVVSFYFKVNSSFAFVVVIGRCCFTVWRGHFLNGGKDVYQASLRSLSLPFLPYKLPEKIEMGKVMSLQQVKQKIPSALFSWSLYTGSHEVSKSGMFCSLFDVVEKDKASPKSLTALLQKLEEEGLVLVIMVKDRGFLFLLSASQMDNSTSNPSESCRPVSSEHHSPIMPQHDSFISALHYALNKAHGDPPADLSATIEQQVYDYLTNLREGQSPQRIRTDYDPKLDVRDKLFPALRQKTNWESFVRPYIYKPAVFTMLLENVKKKVEELRVQTERAAPHNDPVKVKELLKLIQLNKKSSKGKAGDPEALGDTYTLKRKVDLVAHEGSSKRLKTERYSQRQMDYPEDPRFVQSPTVSTHATPDTKDLSPPYQPDSSSTAVDLDVQTAAEVEDEQPVAPALNTECPADSSSFDHIVDELVSGFSSEVEQLLRAKRIYYVACSSTQGSQEPLQTPAVPLSSYVSNYNTPFPVSNYISSFHDSLMMFIDPQHVSRYPGAQEDVTSSSSTAEVPSDVPDTSSSFNPCPTPPPQHHSSLPDPDLQHQMWALEQDSVTQKTREANIPHDEMNGSLVAETTGAMEGQTDASMGHTRSAINSIIDQLQPEVISNLVEIIKGVQKNIVYFYIHSWDEEESDVCWEIKEYLKKLGDLECNPHGFLEKSGSLDKLLVIIQNMDIATQVHKIPSLVSLKKHPSVSFAGVDNLSDIQNHTYNELFQSGGFIVSDEQVLNPAVITAEKLQDILEYIEQLNCPQSPWRWRVHFKSHKKLREHRRLKPDALNLFEILNEYEKRHIVEILSYHDCDTPSRQAPDLDCLVDLQARFIKQRHLIFLTGDLKPKSLHNGIVIANVDDIKFIISSLAGGGHVDSAPSAETYAPPAPASCK